MPSTESELKRALGAFRKRLKVIRLDDDSRLGHGPLSGGSREKVVAIQPPSGFGKAIWEELADLGYLKRDTVGFYELTDKQWQQMNTPGGNPPAGPQ
jgi:hypothetical protein